MPTRHSDSFGARLRANISCQRIAEAIEPLSQFRKEIKEPRRFYNHSQLAGPDRFPLKRRDFVIRDLHISESQDISCRNVCHQSDLMGQADR